MNKPLPLFLSIVFINCLSLPSPSLAIAIDDQPAKQQKNTSDPTKSNELIRKLRGNEPSYFVYAKDNDDSFDHIEFYLSVEYPMLEGAMHKCFGSNTDLYFNYNGKYDFYINKDRYSSPVISRRQNPGIMIKHSFSESLSGLKSIKAGYFHESNGQTIDTMAEYSSTENGGDFVSRGWDYIPLEFKFEFPEKLNGLTFFLKGRYFLDKQFFNIDKEDTVFWDKTDDSKIEDYAGISLIIRSQTVVNDRWYMKGLKLAAIYRTGYTDFNLSQRYEATFRAFDIPLYIFYFSGYGTEISTYQERGYTWGLGVEFW